MTARQIIKRLESLGNPANIAGMARFEIVTKKAFGVSVPVLKELAKVSVVGQKQTPPKKLEIKN